MKSQTVEEVKNSPYGPRSWGRAIRRERERRGLSQYELADMIGVSPDNFSRLEKGRHAIKSELIYTLIVDHGFPLEEFFPAGPIRAAANRIK